MGPAWRRIARNGYPNRKEGNWQRVLKGMRLPWQMPPQSYTIALDCFSKHTKYPRSTSTTSAEGPMSSESKTKAVYPEGTKPHLTVGADKEPIAAFEWSPDGQRLALASLSYGPVFGNRLAVWNLDKRVQEWMVPFEAGGDRCLAWSPDGHTITTGRSFFQSRAGDLIRSVKGGHGGSWGIAWSRDGTTLASGSHDNTVRILNAHSGEVLRSLDGHSGSVESVAWSPDGRTLASASSDASIRLWDGDTGALLRTLMGHSKRATCVAWSPDGCTLASCSHDDTVRVWSQDKDGQTHILEGHTGPVVCLSFSADGKILSSASWDGSVRLWRCDRYEMIGSLPASRTSCSWVAFNPKEPVLATLGEDGRTIQIWHLEMDALLRARAVIGSVSYVNAKIVLVGDSGVGKSGLALVLTGQGFMPTESTHGRRVWSFDSHQVEHAGSKGMRETLLWDLAGQPGYRLIHQLHLNEVAVALVVFDARSETDPFGGVRHWDRALRQAQRLQGDSGPHLKKFLVAARSDRGSIGVSKARIESLVKDLQFDGYFETSAKESWGTAELSKAIREGINWAALPRVTSTELFQRIKSFIVGEKQAGRTLSTLDDLYRAYCKSNPRVGENEQLQREFATCIGRVEAAGLIRRLSFGSLVLLQPELLDAYASALVNAAKDEPDGLGCVLEEDARVGRFRMSKDERIHDVEQEKLLLIATVEDLLRYEIVSWLSVKWRTGVLR